MTAQTVSGAVSRRDRELQLIKWLRGQQEDLAMAAASHLKPSTIVRVAQGALRKDDKLMAAAIANPQSLIHCLLDAARLGHEPGTDQYWLIPFGSEVTGIEGYKGIIERMYRAGGVSSVHAEVVRQRDAYRSMGSRMPPVHEYDEFADPDDRGPLRGVYAYAIMSDGLCSQVMRMGRAEVMKHKAMSRGSDRADSPWQKWEEPMWKKVPLSGLEPYVPTSSEWLIARAQAAATAQGRAISPGWAPSVAGTPAPLQLVAAEVEPEDVPPAETAITPQAQSPSGQRSAGGTSRRAKAGKGGGESENFAGMIVQRFESLGITDRNDRLILTAQLLRLDDIPASTNKLSAADQRRLWDAMEKSRDLDALVKLMATGEVAQDAADGEVPGEQ